MQELKLVYRPFVEETLIGSSGHAGTAASTITTPDGRKVYTTEFDVDTGAADVVTLVANPVSPHATVSIDYPDFDPAQGGRQVKLAGEGTSVTIKVTVTNRDGDKHVYVLNVTRQLSGDTRLGALSVTETGDGLIINLEPEFITEWNEATGQPRRARYRATLLFNERDGGAENAVVTVQAKELHAGAVTHISATLAGVDLFDADRNADGFQIALSDAGPQQMLRVVINVRAEEFVRTEHRDSLHDYELIIVKRYGLGNPPPVLAEALKGLNDYHMGVSLFVDWRDGQSCDKPYNVATEYMTDTQQGWLSHPVTSDGEVLNPDGETYTALPQRTHLWLDSESLEVAFGPATAERRDTTIEV